VCSCRTGDGIAESTPRKCMSDGLGKAQQIRLGVNVYSESTSRPRSFGSRRRRVDMEFQIPPGVDNCGLMLALLNTSSRPRGRQQHS
jgi:hypothetical protein